MNRVVNLGRLRVQVRSGHSLASSQLLAFTMGKEAVCVTIAGRWLSIGKAY